MLPAQPVIIWESWVYFLWPSGRPLPCKLLAMSPKGKGKVRIYWEPETWFKPSPSMAVGREGYSTRIGSEPQHNNLGWWKEQCENSEGRRRSKNLRSYTVCWCFPWKNWWSLGSSYNEPSHIYLSKTVPEKEGQWNAKVMSV
jgi:hypothetical protein